MDRESTESYGWIVILVLVLAVMVALAAPAGKYIREAISGTSGALSEVADDTNYEEAEQKAEDIFGTHTMSPEDIYG